jgi:hypothetical protein
MKPSRRIVLSRLSVALAVQALLLVAVPSLLAQRAKQIDRELPEVLVIQREIAPEQNPADLSTVDEKTYVGNVYGSVVDAQTGQPLAGVEIVLTGEPIVKSKKPTLAAIATARGGYISFPRGMLFSNLRTITNENGEFLINSIPTPYPEKPYTILASLPGYVSQVLNQVPVRPGAVMALHLNIRLESGFGKVQLFEKEARRSGGGDDCKWARYSAEDQSEVFLKGLRRFFVTLA